MEGPLVAEKRAAARAAVDRVRPGMVIALGTGSTATVAIHELGARRKALEPLIAVASSPASERSALEVGLAVRPLAEGDRFDLMIDGADEVASDLTLTKGGGGALLREKLLARHAAQLLIAVDHTKLVRRPGERSPIPIEIVPFARPTLLHRLAEEGLRPELRRGPSGDPFRTDNGNELLDLRPSAPVHDPAGLDRRLRALTGVIETGLFVALAPTVFVGEPDGSVRTLSATAVPGGP